MKDLLSILSSHWPSLALLCLSAIPAAYMHVHDHNHDKMRFMGDWEGFFGLDQSRRKWSISTGPGFRVLTPPPSTWYYRFFKLAHKERFPLSATALSMLTDCYHASQALMRILMSLSITLAIGAPWWSVIAIWWTYAAIHALFYKLLSR